MHFIASLAPKSTEWKVDEQIKKKKKTTSFLDGFLLGKNK